MNLWDKKAKTYARYQNTLNTIQKQTVGGKIKCNHRKIK